MNFSAISSSFLGHSSLFTELLLMFWYLPVSLNVNKPSPLGERMVARLSEDLTLFPIIGADLFEY